MSLFDSRRDTSRASPLASAAALLLALGLVLAPAAPALASDPSGNNGTVKVHDGGLEPRPEIRNRCPPHDPLDRA